jgi:hypothetical protein
MTELEMAMMVASKKWPGTSLVDGAMYVLAEIYGPHEHVGKSDEKCTRCGKEKSDPLHSQ